ncbi:MAG TPA: NUDIX domain-containing protein [Candidatus Dormibacteraeota bacterium]|nr:NUDIX domain-containing protein [Candidatus Dormibacteraeota bacterium]
MDDELLDLVDSNDKVIGTILRSETEKLTENKLGFIRASDMFIQNDDGKLWIPKRTANKKIAPNGLDYSMGGHVASGETYIESALREIQEELNLTLFENDLIFVKKFGPTVSPYFRNLYIYKSNNAPDYNPEDFVSASWLTPREVIEKIDAGVLAKSTLRETVEVLI